MDITRGEFEEFCPRSSRPSTRSSLRSETVSSMEILPPEEDGESLFMAEELEEEDDLYDEDNTPSPLYCTNSSSHSTTLARTPQSQDSEASEECRPQRELRNDQNRSRCSSEMSDTLFPGIDDPNLREAIRKMRKYDRILSKKVKREKEVKRQRLLFQKQMLVELTTPEPNRDEAAAITNKYLALMPADEKLDEMLEQIATEEFTPIFPTQITAENHSIQSSALIPPSSGDKSVPDGHTNETPSMKEDEPNSTTRRSDHSAKIDFIKRNIELAKDASSYVSMTDDEKKRLNELLSDLDNMELTDSEMQGDAFTVAVVAGEGYTPSEEGTKRLAEIDEKIKYLTPPADFNDISVSSFNRFSDHRPSISNDDANDRLKMIEGKLDSLDEEWRQLCESRGPRLSDEALQKLLNDCGCSSSRLPSRFSSNFSGSSQSTCRTESTVTNDDVRCDSSHDAGSARDDISEYSSERPLSPLTLESLLEEARSSLGISKTGISISPGRSTSRSFLSREYVESPLFEAVSRERISRSSESSDLDIEDA